ncbi:MAG: 4-phosphopantetheinyl transferase [Xanthomonadaceae bacterium]|nr:4-phosphopantetheinyl transferase [Xanthomonadaceae bacterium]
MPSPLLPETVRYVWRPHPHGTPAEPVVRQWLGEQLDCADDAVPLVRDVLGRPRLSASQAGFDVNWSHSGDGLLIGLGEGLAIGADLERIRPRPRALDLARRFLAASEVDWLAGLPSDLRTLAFIRLWCVKEAVLKAHGRGLAFGLDKLVFAEDAGTLRLYACDRALGEPADWSLHEFEPHPGYRAALAWRPQPR